MGGAGVQHHQPPAFQRKRGWLDGQRGEVDPQGVSRLSDKRRELVEKARLRPDPVVLHARAQLRQLDAIGVRVPSLPLSPMNVLAALASSEGKA